MEKLVTFVGKQNPDFLAQIAATFQNTNKIDDRLIPCLWSPFTIGNGFVFVSDDPITKS